VLLLVQIAERLPREAPARLALVGQDDWRSVTAGRSPWHWDPDAARVIGPD
jgi:hypothetical protein